MEAAGIKKVVGGYAVDAYVKSGMKLGLGTGSTAIWVVRRVAQKLEDRTLENLLCVPTSTQTELECHHLGVPIRSMNDPAIGGRLDCAIDGADEVDSRGQLIKGGGGALLREKMVEYAAEMFVVVVDETKVVERLGASFPVAVEVMPEARETVLRKIRDLGGQGEVRIAERKMGFVITDNGNLLIDVRFSGPIDPQEMERDLNAIPGVVENGFFTRVRPVVCIGFADGSVATRDYR
jgi:ribose 5-phosphate isomerase A